MIMDQNLYRAKPKGETWGVGVLLLNNGKMLLGRRTDNNTWGSPGGGVEDDETPIDAIIREVKEETNLDINVFNLTFVYRNYSYNENAIWNSFVFVCDRFTGDMKPQAGEVEELKWVPIEDLWDYVLFTPTRESIMVTLQRNPELKYPQLIEKMTSIEQLVDIKNPGKNGGMGNLSTAGWQYKKPGSTHGVNRALPENNQPNKLQELKQSYITYFQNLNNFKQVYKVQDGKFVFPEYSNAKSEGLVEDKKSYERLFKEQYIHFALNNKQSNKTT
jgi:mutator protein MutT